MNRLLVALLLTCTSAAWPETSDGKPVPSLVSGQEAFAQVADGMRQSPTTQNQILTKEALAADLKELMTQFFWARQSIKARLNPNDDAQLQRFAAQASLDPYATDPLIRLVLAGETYEQLLSAQKDLKGANQLRASLDRITNHLIWVAGMKDRFIDEMMVTPITPKK